MTFEQRALAKISATLEWIDRFNDGRRREPIGNIPSAEAEERYYAMPDDVSMAS